MTVSAADAHPYPIYNARYRVIFPILDADGDLVTGATGLDSEASQDSGTFADVTNEATEIATSSGMYYLDLIATELDTNSTAIIVKTSSSGAKTTPIVLYPVRLPVIRTGTAQAGANSTITLDSSASAIDDYYNGCYINITNNSPSNVLGQARRITDYVGSTKVATIEATWGTNPSSASTFEILATAEWIQAIADINSIEGVALGTHASGMITSDVRDIAGSSVSTSTAQLGVNVVNFGGSAGAFASGRPETNTTHIAGSAVSTSSAQVGVNVVNWKGSAAATVDSAGYPVVTVKDGTGQGEIATTSGAIDTVTGVTNGVTVGTNNDKTGYSLSSAGIQAIWDALTAALTTASSIGKLLVDNINATISSRATPAQVNAEVVDALNVDTYAEPGQEAPPATTTLVKKLGYVYKAFRNKKTQTATTLSLYADDASTVDQKAAISDDGTTYTHGELGTGP